MGFIGILVLSCSKDKDTQSNRCELETIQSAGKYITAPSDELTIESLEIEDDCLKIAFLSGGCQGDTWEVKLIDSDAILESNPPQRNLRLSLKNRETCEALIKKEITFDVSNLQVDGKKVQLNLTNSGDKVLYEY